MSLFSKFTKNYNKLPLWLLKILAPFFHLLPTKVRMGKSYKKEMAVVRENNKLSAEETSEKQNIMFCNLIQYAYAHVKYYRELFDENNLKPSDFHSIEDIIRLPFLTKDILLSRKDDLISDEFSKDSLCYITTSGSTGTPASFYVENDSSMRDVVYTYVFFEELGYSANSSKLLLRGKKFYSQKKGKTFQWDSFKKELSVDIFSMTEENMEGYCSAIEKYKPDFAYGYMSAMYYFCKYLEKRKKPLRHRFKGFISISETLVDVQKEYVESIIKAPVVTFYGMSERVVIAKKCLKTGKYHIEPLYGIAEIVDTNGAPIKEKGKIGEIVGTSLLNYGMPLIRYKTGDLSSWGESECNCKNKLWTLTDIVGRTNNDALINCDLQPISMASLEVHSYVYDYIKRYQFFQDCPGRAIIKIVPNDSTIDDKILNDIKQLFQERTLNKISFEVLIVDNILPKSNGKLSILDQRLDLKSFTNSI